MPRLYTILGKIHQNIYPITLQNNSYQLPPTWTLACPQVR